MYRLNGKIKDGTLEKYGFRLGRDWPDSRSIISNEYELSDYWLFPLHPDNENSVYLSEDDLPIWSIQIMSNGTLWIECVPNGTYHISNSDMEQMFYVLRQMIVDSLIVDDYKLGGS